MVFFPPPSTNHSPPQQVSGENSFCGANTNANTLPEASTRGRLGTCVGAMGNNDGRGPDDRVADAPPSRFRQKNNNQLATGAAKASCGRQESVENHTVMTTGDDVSVQWMTERGGGR